MPWRYEIDPTAAGKIEARVDRLLNAAADSLADTLQEDLSHEEGGRGRKYSGLPNRSSAPGQHPRRQFGDLAEGVFMQPTNEKLRKLVGIANNPQGKLNRLAFDPYSMGGRKVGELTFRATETLKRAATAMRSVPGDGG